jgi:hypothetical protein
MKKSLLVLVASALLITFFPGAAKAASSDTTIYPIVCASSIVNIYLEYGVSSITITNPNGCSGTGGLYLFFGKSGTTWTYSKTIGGNTTAGSYDPDVSNLSIGTLGSADSFTLTLTSTSDSKISAGNAQRQFDMYFYKQINTLNPDPVGLGQQVTVTGNNLSSVTSLMFYGTNSFSATTANRTATQLTFTVPLTVTDYWGVTSNVTPGIYRSASAEGKTLTLIAAPIVVSVSAEETARLAAVAAAALREDEKRSARNVISSDFKNYVDTNLSFFRQAEIGGITAENIGAVQAEITALPMHSSGDIAGILKIARKYEVVGMIASGRMASIQSKDLIEIGLIPEGSKNKAALLAVVKKLSASQRSSYAAIKAAVDAKMAEIQARKDRAAALKALIASRRPG